MPSKTLVVRCHSFDSFSAWPHLSNFRAVDGIIFVADHIRRIFQNVYSDLPCSKPHTAVIQNIRDLDILSHVTKVAGARKTLGMLKYASANKDPLFALEILDELRRKDTGWSIRFAGGGWGDGDDHAELQYAREFSKRLAAVSDSVCFDPYLDEPSDWFSKVGFMLSTSQREGSHESIVEGMAAGCVPVIRRWPMVKDFGAPESVFPEVPSFERAEDAASYILARARDFESASQQARRTALSHYDMRTSGPALISFLKECQELRRDSTKII
jgi:hypothetical protein